MSRIPYRLLLYGCYLLFVININFHDGLYNRTKIKHIQRNIWRQNKFRYTFNNIQKINETSFYIHYVFNMYCCNTVSIIVLYIIYLDLTIFNKMCNVLTYFDNSKSLGRSDQKWCIATILLEHCNFAIGALRLGLGHSSRGAFRQRGIPTIIHNLSGSILLIC